MGAEKSQITLHIPVELEKQLRLEYLSAPTGQRGRFSEYVFQFILAGRAARGFSSDKAESSTGVQSLPGLPGGEENKLGDAIMKSTRRRRTA